MPTWTLIISLALLACGAGCATTLPAPAPAAPIQTQRVPSRPLLNAGEPGGTVLASCPDFGPVVGPTTTIRVAALPTEMRLPGTFHEESVRVPEGTVVPQRWVGSDKASIMISRAASGMIPGFAVVGYDGVQEPQCAATFAGIRSYVSFFLQISSGLSRDTLYQAGVDVPLPTGEFLSAQVIARSAAERRALLAALRDMKATPAP